MNTILKLVISVAILTATIVTVADGICCALCPGVGRCLDKTSCRPLSTCCAYGRCNIFCCSCAGACRPHVLPVESRNILDEDIEIGFHADQTKSEANNFITAIQRFDKLDENRNGGIEFSEFMSHFENLAAFQGLDIDWNGKISLEEFDADAANTYKKLQN